MAPYHLIGVTHAVVVGIIVHDGARAVRFTGARLTNAVDIDTGCRISRRAIVIARRDVLAPDNFVGIAHAVIICVVVHHGTGAVRLTGASFTTLGKDAGRIVVGGRNVVVTSQIGHTAGDFQLITDAVAVGIAQARIGAVVVLRRVGACSVV